LPFLPREIIRPDNGGAFLLPPSIEEELLEFGHRRSVHFDVGIAANRHVHRATRLLRKFEALE